MESNVSNAVLRAATLLEKQPRSWTRPAGGYTPAERWVVSFTDGTSCFVKAATNELTSGWLRAEYERVYARLQAPFLPRMLAWEDDELPLLVLEDLSSAHWPPPWSPARVDAVLSMLKEVHATRLAGLPPVRSRPEVEDGTWRSLDNGADDFLRLGLCSEEWLTQAFPALMHYEEIGLRQISEGEVLLHLDVRSDNICFVKGLARLVDWNWASTGNGRVDVALWLPSLHSEGGPLPETILPDAPQWAALVSGFFASRAGEPGVPNAPRVREVQLSQLRSALPWAQRALGLAPLDGPRW